ncbi:MAG: divergent PAP2 family protein [Lachnospiraceae bacterium]
MINEILQNQILICGCLGWGIAQILKTIIYAGINKKIDWKRLFGDGGMPSGHSATVTAMAVRSFLIYGAGSFEFAVTFMLAIIVMHDAMGVRQETGKQAKIIKDLASFMESLGRDITDEEKLKEFVGHTPLQVTAGAIIGALVALLLP